MSETSAKKPYTSPELRVYGPMNQLTHSMWWGLYPGDRVGKLQLQKPPMWMWMMGMMMNMS